MNENNKAAKKNIDLTALKKSFKKTFGTAAKHAGFIGILAVLIAYLVMVWSVSQLVSSEAQAEEAASSIPKIDQNAIKQIQSLEQSNSAVKSIFEQARNNPFQE